jgi:Fe-S cluster assembly protein SufD
MNVAVMKTKAEQALTQAFAAAVDKLPGGQPVVELRKRAIGTFAGLGLPHRRIEEWKYTDLRTALREAYAPSVADGAAASAGDLDAALGPLAGVDAYRVVFINGVFRPELSGLEAARGFEVEPLSEALAKWPNGVTMDLARLSCPEDAVIALNTAFMTDGAVLQIADGAVLDKPLLIVFARAGKDARAVTTRNALRVGAGATATIVEAHVALAGAAAEAQSNATTEIRVGDGATVTHVKLTTEGVKATHLATWVAILGSAVSYRPFQLTAGMGLARNQLFITFKGEGTKLDLSGAFLGRSTEHIDTTLVVDHAVPRCQSRELFKGVLDGRARGVFQGKIIVRPDAQKTDGKQMAQALMLSEDAEFDSKPELEILADDVACGHGSTSAEIDPSLIFYCRSRGIPEAEARALLVEAFIGEAIEKVEHAAVRGSLMDVARAWLQQGTAATAASQS